MAHKFVVKRTMGKYVVLGESTYVNFTHELQAEAFAALLNGDISRAAEMASKFIATLPELP